MFARTLVALVATCWTATALAQDAEAPEPTDEVAAQPADDTPEAPPAQEPVAPPPDPADKADESIEKAAPTARIFGLDQEDRGSALEQQDKRLEAHLFFETEWHEYNNLDFRPLDESSDQAILDSDDRGGFAFTGISLELGYRIDPQVRFVLGTSYRGLWGGDQIGNVNRFGGFLFFNSLYVEYTPKTKSGWAPIVRLGRQRFEIGGLGGAKEFILADNIDALRIDFPIPGVGRIITIPIETVGLSADNDDVTFVGYVGQSNPVVFGFRGDRMTRRHGLILQVTPDAVPDLDARAYAYYSDIGASGSGSDISYGGRLGNFSDNDWVFNAGARVSYRILDRITPWAEFDISSGIDRKELVTNDVNTNGMAWGAGLVVRDGQLGDRGFGYSVDLGYFEAQGPVYADNGQLYSHGYVGLKARQVGGLLANRFLGWHPTAYVDAYGGIRNEPQETDRKSGTRVLRAGATVSPGPVTIFAGYWFMQDTGSTLLDMDDIDTITPPFGYSREEYRAQERLGKVLGHEVDLVVGVNATKSLRFYLQGGVLLPGAYYGTEIGRIAGSALGSSDPAPFWDASGGANVRF